MFSIFWCDKKGAYWCKRTTDKNDAIKTIESLFKRHISATCNKVGHPAVWGAVWQMDDGKWNYFCEGN